MFRGFTGADGPELYGLLAEGAGDILLRLDPAGFICEASPGLKYLGIDISQMLFAPHVADLAARAYSRQLRHYWSETVAGSAPANRMEFPLAGPQANGLAEQWYALALRPVLDPMGPVTGSVAIMRAVERPRALEEELLAATMTDPLTGLGNRHAFQSILSRHLSRNVGGAVILFGIDRFRAIVLRYGQSKGDEVLWAFAQFLRAMLGDDPVLVRMEGERFAAILPDVSDDAAQALANEAVETFTALARGSNHHGTCVSASAGVASLAGHHDQVLATAELALTLVQASGGRRAAFRPAVTGTRQDRKRA